MALNAVRNFRQPYLLYGNRKKMFLKRTYKHLVDHKNGGLLDVICVRKLPLLLSGKKLPKTQHLRGLKLTSVNRQEDFDCGVKAAAQGTCHREREKKPKCEIVKRPKWTGHCLKVCSPCCRPIVVPIDCQQIDIESNECKSISYKYPSYTETINFQAFYKDRSDCCYDPKCMPFYGVGTTEIKARLKDTQKMKLGLPPNSQRFFSTYAILYKNNNSKNTEVDVKNLPCLKKSEDKTSGHKKIARPGECKKLCMPCCRPARDPPDCFFPYVKQPCKKQRPPRPAYSECMKDRTKIVEPCECIVTVLPRCDQLQASGKNNKANGKKEI